METLEAPTNIKLDARILSWDVVENASGYVVDFNGSEYETNGTTLDLHFHGEGGEYDIKVKAIGDGKGFWSSDWSEKTTFTLWDRVASGYDEEGFYYTLLEDGSGYEISRGKKSSIEGVVTFPDYFGDYPVKRIAEFWCGGEIKRDVHKNLNCNSVTTGVILPSKLESIGNGAFKCFIAIEEIDIPDSVEEIEQHAFEGCKKLKRVALPKNLKKISDECFKNTALSEIILPDALEEIGLGAFECDYEEIQSGYKKEQLGSTTVHIPQYITSHITSELSSITIPSSVKRISRFAFLGRENLEIINLHSNLELIEARAFEETKWYENKSDGFVFFGEGDCYIYKYKGVIPDGVVDNIPVNVSAIAGGAFQETNLRKIIIPDGVKLLGDGIFRGCCELTEVKLPSDLTEIPNSTFDSCSNLKNVSIPDTVEKIGALAFGFSGLEKVTVPKNCKTIGMSAFGGCIYLTELIFNECVEVIGENAFSGTKLKHVILPESLKTVSGHLFASLGLNESDGASYLETIYIPASLEYSCPISSENVSLTHIFYGGSSSQWSELVKNTLSRLSLDMYDDAVKQGRYNFENLYFYSEEKPETPGNYWHYVDGKITVWTY